MIGGISGSYYNPYLAYGYYGSLAQNRNASNQASQVQNTQKTPNIWAAQRTVGPDVPVEPVNAVKPVNPNEAGTSDLAILLRRGADPVEMAMRLKVQYGDSAASGEASEVGAAGVQKAMEEGECKTCEQRKYQDGSDDMGVSYQTPTRIDPDQVASAVRGHEMEHVVREQAKAQREGRKVVSQSVTLHTAICPECGKAYISGGTTRTVTAAAPEKTQDAEPQQSGVFSAVA